MPELTSRKRKGKGRDKGKDRDKSKDRPKAGKTNRRSRSSDKKKSTEETPVPATSPRLSVPTTSPCTTSPTTSPATAEKHTADDHSTKDAAAGKKQSDSMLGTVFVPVNNQRPAVSPASNFKGRSKKKKARKEATVETAETMTKEDNEAPAIHLPPLDTGLPLLPMIAPELHSAREHEDQSSKQKTKKKHDESNKAHKHSVKLSDFKVPDEKMVEKPEDGAQTCYQHAPTPNANTPIPNASTPTPNANTPTPNANTPTPNANTPTPNANTPTPNASTPTTDSPTTGSPHTPKAGSDMPMSVYVFQAPE